jgi:hypothetical protein
MGRASWRARNLSVAVPSVAVVTRLIRVQKQVTNVPLKPAIFPAKMYLLDINPDRLISGEKQSVG